MKMPTVSIVIPAYNEEAVIEKCVRAAAKQTVLPDEVIVVNNKSTDNTAAIVERLAKEITDVPIHLLDESTAQGIIPARNTGFNAVKSDVIGRIDADSIIEPHWVEVVKQIFTDEDVAAATGPVLYHDMPMKNFGRKADNALRQFVLRMSSDYQFMFGSNMALRTSAWRKIKTITARDTADELHEDIDLSLCLVEKGLRIQYSEEMIGSMSARRLRDSPKDFHRYVMRFDRTYRHHGVKDLAPRIPILIYLAIYFPLKAFYALYGGK